MFKVLITLNMKPNQYHSAIGFSVFFMGLVIT